MLIIRKIIFAVLIFMAIVTTVVFSMFVYNVFFSDEKSPSEILFEKKEIKRL
ncbi:MAG: hypothetical protein J6M14_03915 [Campylobacter sp.]|nr:hypothetical protein [Campylobacter sp.]